MGSGLTFRADLGLRFKCGGSVLVVDIVVDVDTDTHSSASDSESEISESKMVNFSGPIVMLLVAILTGEEQPKSY